MNNEIQLFQNGFNVSFPRDTALQLLKHMEDLHGTEFGKKFNHIKSQSELVDLACITLSGVTAQEFQQGIQRLHSEKWCPNLPEFRAWCTTSSDWWSVDLAWSRAINFLDDKTTQITVIAKNALDEVKQILLNEGQKTAHFAFRDVYNNLVSQAQQDGQIEVLYDAATDKSKDTKSEKYAPHQPSLLEQMSDEEKAIFDRMRNLIADGMNQRLAHRQATAEYFALKKQTFGKTNKMEQIKRSRQERVTPYHEMIKSGVSPAEAFKTVLKGRA